MMVYLFSRLKASWFCKTAVLLVTIVMNGPAWPLTIVSPRQGELVMPGQVVWVIVQPDSAAETEMSAVQIIAPGASGCEEVQLTIPLQCALTVPAASVGPPTLDIRVIATFSDGTVSNVGTQLTLPTNETPVALVALGGNPRELPLVFEAIGQEKNLTVTGEATDGATHDLRGREKGTVYEIGNPIVVQVKDDGLVIARGIGTTTITVSYGALSFDVPVIVRDRINNMRER